VLAVQCDEALAKGELTAVADSIGIPITESRLVVHDEHTPWRGELHLEMRTDSSGKRSDHDSRGEEHLYFAEGRGRTARF